MLDSRKTVRWAKIRSSEITIPMKGTYTFQGHRGWRIVQRFCLWVLDKIGAHAEEKSTIYTRTPQENDDLLKSLLGQEGQWIELVHSSNTTPRIYMGPDDHKELYTLCEATYMMPITFSGRIETRDRYTSKWHDIPITVVPWMSGAVLVPE